MSYSEAEAERLKEYTKEIIDEEYAPIISNLRKKLDDHLLTEIELKKRLDIQKKLIDDQKKLLDGLKRCEKCQQLNGFSTIILQSQDPIPSTSGTAVDLKQTNSDRAYEGGRAAKMKASSVERLTPTPSKSSAETLGFNKNYNNTTMQPTDSMANDNPPTAKSTSSHELTKPKTHLPKEMPEKEPELIEIDSD